jgi:hypothetical protein
VQNGFGQNTFALFANAGEGTAKSKNLPLIG